MQHSFAPEMPTLQKLPLSIPFLGFRPMQPMNAVEAEPLRGWPGSQFPFWDFVECNLPGGGDGEKRGMNTLNSLSGISVNATFPQNTKIPNLLKNTLNSLSGISVNATDAVSAVFRGIGGENQRVLPLTPLLLQAL
jgi:hypothetical protein